MIIPGQFGFNCPSGFREEAFWNIFPIGSKVKLKTIYQNLLETTFDTNNYCRPTLVSWLVRVRDVIHFFYLSQSLSLSTSFVPTHSAYLDYNLFNLHVANWKIFPKYLCQFVYFVDNPCHSCFSRKILQQTEACKELFALNHVTRSFSGKIKGSLYHTIAN
jgi:hypothetical protein